MPSTLPARNITPKATRYSGRTAERNMMEQNEFFKRFEPPKPRNKHPAEWKVVALRDCPLPEHMQICDTPQQAADYWRIHVVQAAYFNPEAECFIVVHVNTRRKVKGHHLASIGTLDTILVHPREVFRAALIAAAGAIVLMHNHPSGDPTPSESDIKVTRDLIRAGQLLKVEVLDHIIIGRPKHSSLRELGYFAV
jgi:DNA repair protein RadC